MKENFRVLGVDDGPFRRDVDSETCLTGVMMRADGTIEKILVGYIPIDGDMAKGVILGFLEQLGNQSVSAVISEGITFGGFDIVNPDEISSISGIPFISITKGKGDLDAMEEALKMHGDTDKIRALQSISPIRVHISGVKYTVNISGISREGAMEILHKTTRVGNVPEPVRIADMVSGAIMESRKEHKE